MRKFLLAAAVIVCSISAALAQATLSKQYNLSGFTAIDASFTYQVNVTKGSSGKIEVICPEGLAQYMDIRVTSGTLYFKMNMPRNFKYKTRGDQSIKVNMQMQEITAVNLSGASSFVATGDFRADVFKCSLSGASSIKNTLNITGNKFIYELSGASSAKIAGHFNEMSGHASGATSLTIHGNIARNKISVSGSSKFVYNGNSSEFISVDASGATGVILKGSTPVITIDCSGASRVTANEMITQKATASASGASTIKVYADDIMSLSTTGASSIRYYGNAQNISKHLPSSCSIEPGAPSVVVRAKDNVSSLRNISSGAQPLIVLNGVKVPGLTTESINLDDVASVTVLKTKDYGPEGANGVILITTKGQKKTKGNVFPLQDIAAGAQPLIILNGVKVPGLTTVNADDIASITVLKTKEAETAYGSEGANGVILITTKDQKK